jgi:hypothetical protein
LSQDKGVRVNVRARVRVRVRRRGRARGNKVRGNAKVRGTANR